MSKGIKVLTIKSNSYKRHHVTGFWGGLTPDGQNVSIELFEDAPAMVDEVTLITGDGNAISGQDFKQPEFPIHRHVQTGITVPSSHLPVLIEWLKDRYEEHLQQQGERKNLEGGRNGEQA